MDEVAQTSQNSVKISRPE